MNASAAYIAVGLIIVAGLGWLLYRATQSIQARTHPRVGVVVHETTPADMNRLLQLPAPMARTTDYGDTASAGRIAQIASNMIPQLVVLRLGAVSRPVDINAALQLGNEPDVSSVSAEQYGAAFRANAKALRALTAAPIVTAGFSNDASADYIRRALLAGASDADAICFHVYGSPLRDALSNRLAVVQLAMQQARCTKPLWITEIGVSAVGQRSVVPDTTSVAQQRDELAAALALAHDSAVARVYVYALATDELSDHYGVCWHDDPRTPRPAYFALQDAMAAANS